MINNRFIQSYQSLPIAHYYMDSREEADLGDKAGNAVYTVMHNHSELEILYIEQGKATMEIDGVSYALSDGDLVLINPLEVHFGEYPTGQKRFSCFCIDFDINLLAVPENEEQIRSLESGELKYIHHIPASHKQSRELVGLMKNVYKAVLKKVDGWEYAVRGNLFLFFSVLVSNRMELQLNKNAKQNRRNDFARKSLHFVEAHFSEPVSSRDAAIFFSYNHSYFCRLFKDVFNESFNEYLIIYRLSKAKALLTTTRMTVAEIGAKVGFSNQSYFSQSFKKVFGILPSEYRRNTAL